MFGIGMTEIVVILVIALLIFGPDKLPGLARSLGKGFGEFRRASYDLRQSLVEAADAASPGAESEKGEAQSRTTPPPAAPRPDQAGAPPQPGNHTEKPLPPPAHTATAPPETKDG